MQKAEEYYDIYLKWLLMIDQELAVSCIFEEVKHMDTWNLDPVSANWV